MNKEQFDKLYVDEKVVINCKTEELADEFLKMVNEFGYKWRTGQSYMGENPWYMYRDNTCYNIKNGVFADIDYYKDNSYNIIEFNGFDNNQEILTHKDLKENIIYKDINSQERYIIRNNKIYNQSNTDKLIKNANWFINAKFVEIEEDKKQ